MLADELIAAHEAAREVAPFSDRYPGLTAAQGYAAARALHEHRTAHGWRPVGRKIGFTNRTLWARYGVFEPMWGTVYDRTLIDAPQASARVALDGLVNPRIEPEICFGLAHSPRVEDVAAAVAWIAHSIEIVQCHHPAWKVTIGDCTASNGLHGRLIVGPRQPFRREMARQLPSVEALLYRAGSPVDRGTGANVLGSPLLALEHLVQMLDRQGGEPLREGEIISTGVMTDAHPVRVGEAWTTRIEGLPLPGLTIEFA
ncbi:MAG TPA: decarboxylase [Burkholderiales bacterium]|nr:decarboxylase [Burkholderiales bacterium]